MESSSNFAKQAINSVSFSSDSSFIAIATNIGFRIYSTNPLALKRQRDFGTPLQFVELINKSNLIALVGEKQTPYTPPNRLAIFDDKRQKIIADLNFCSRIKQVKIRLNKIVVALYNKVFLIDLFSLQIEHILQTFKFQENQAYNLISLSNESKNFILAAPSIQNGQISLIYLSKLTQRKIKAHQQILSAALLTQNGQKIATSSDKENQIHIFDTKTGQKMQQVRRGSDLSHIWSICFSKGGKWLAVSSSCNIRIYVVGPSQAEKQTEQKKNAEKQLSNPKSLFFFLKGFFPSFDAEYSFCSHKYEEEKPDKKTWLSFENDQLLSMSNLESFQRLELNLKGGKCRSLQKTTEILNRELAQK